MNKTSPITLSLKFLLPVCIFALRAAAQTYSDDSATVARILDLNDKDYSVALSTETEDGRIVSFDCIYLSELPPSIGNLSALKKLEINSGYITVLPSELTKLTRLEILRMRNHKFTALPDSIGKLVNLRALNISDNNIQTLPESLRNCRSLRHFSAYGCFTDSGIPDQLLSLDSLEYLEMRMFEKPADTVPASLANLQMLDTLILYGHYPSTFPPVVGKLPGLKYLRMWSLEGPIPAEIGNLRELRYLDLSAGSGLVFPPEVVNLTNLRSLNVELCKLKNLEEVAAFPAVILQCGLNDFATVDIPPSSPLALSLEVLNIDAAGSSTATLPSEIAPSFGSLHKLRRLYINKSDLSELPDAMCSLSAIETLSIAQTGLLSIPGCIGECVNLKIMNFSDSHFDSLPASFGKLEKLVSLALRRDDRLKKLPATLYQLTSLENLVIGEGSTESPFCEISPEIKNLSGLRKLIVKNCSLHDLPVEITALKSVKVTVDSNYLDWRLMDSSVVRWLDSASSNKTGWRTMQKITTDNRAAGRKPAQRTAGAIRPAGNGSVVLTLPAEGVYRIESFSIDGTRLSSRTVRGSRTIPVPVKPERPVCACSVSKVMPVR